MALRLTLAFFLFLLLSILDLANAADCSGDKGEHPDQAWAWDVRQSMCGDNGCALQEADQGSVTPCTLLTHIRNRTVARAFRSTTTGKYDNCWDALSDAISQCFRDTSVPYAGETGNMQGNWESSGESYWIQILTDDEFVVMEPAEQGIIGAVEMEQVDNDPTTPGRDYVYGPQKYCIGLGPGGETCLDIGEGCFILSPYDNTVPEIICG